MLKTTLKIKLRYYYANLGFYNMKRIIRESLEETRRVKSGGSVNHYNVDSLIAGLSWKYVKTLQKDKSKKKEIEEKYKLLKQVVDKYGVKFKNIYGEKCLGLTCDATEVDNLEKAGLKILQAFNKELAEEIELYKNGKLMDNGDKAIPCDWEQLDQL